MVRDDCRIQRQSLRGSEHVVLANRGARSSQRHATCCILLIGRRRATGGD